MVKVTYLAGITSHISDNYAKLTTANTQVTCSNENSGFCQSTKVTTVVFSITELNKYSQF